MSNEYKISTGSGGIITESFLRDSSKHGESPTDTNDLLIAKIVAMIVLGLVSFILGMLPIKLAKWFHWQFRNGETNDNNLIISLLLCFGGGVLMFTTFLHLQPEVREGIQSLINSGYIPEIGHGINLAELIFCLGFFFVYLIEEVVHSLLDRKHNHNEDEAVLHRTMSLRRCSRHPNSSEENPTLIPRVSLNQNNDLKSLEPNTKSTSTQGLLDTASVSTIHEPPASLDNSAYPCPKFAILDPELNMTGSLYYPPKEKETFNSSQKDEYFMGSDIYKTEALPKFYGNNVSEGPPSVTYNKPSAGHHHSHILDEDDSNSSASNYAMNNISKSFRGFFAILALSFHAIFEGLAVGLEMSVSNVWYLFLAVATHKFVISFCVGIELLSSRTKLFLTIVYIGTFAVVSPIGIGIGIALSDQEATNSSELVTLILQGMAAGTLLYVVFFEVLQRERANSQSGIFQLVAIMAGFGVMFALQIITGHEHHHGGDEDEDRHDHHEYAATAIGNITTHLVNNMINHQDGLHH